MIKESKWVLAVAAGVLLTLAVSQADGLSGAAGDEPRAQTQTTHYLLDLGVDSNVPGHVSVELVADGEVIYIRFNV